MKIELEQLSASNEEEVSDDEDEELVQMDKIKKKSHN